MHKVSRVVSIFNVSKDTITVEDVASLCKKINSKLEIIKTNDKIPNQGYSLSNQKLLKTGFKFLYNLDESIFTMIQKWSLKNNNTNLEYKTNGENL